MNDIDLLSVARTGIDAEAFARSDIGKFLIGKAEREVAILKEELVDADPSDWKMNNDIRNKIHVARMFLTWLDEAMQVGRNAHEQLRELDDLAGAG